MRVLMLSKACLVGTYQRKLELLAEQGIELIVAVPPRWRDERGTLVLERSYTRGYRLVVLPLALNGSFHLHFYPTFGRLVRRLRPDLVHLDEEPYNFATFHANLLARHSGARTLWFSWQNLLRRYPPPFAWMERYNVHHVEGAIAGSHSSAEVWRAKGYRGPLEVIPQFGVDPELFSPPLRRAGTVHFAYVGRLVEEKGVDLFLAALAALPRGGWRATVLGSGPMESALRAQASRLGLKEVTFRAPLPSTRMPDFFRAVDVLVLPSRTRPNWKEQFGRVLIEAMACEAAVVGAKSGEIPYVIGEAGLLFSEGKVEALTAHLRRLLTDEMLRRALGRRGRERVLANFTQQQVARRTAAFYRRLLGDEEVR